jgi:hypothetical protein
MPLFFNISAILISSASQRSGPHLAHHLVAMDPDGNITNADCSGDLLVRLTSRSLNRTRSQFQQSASIKQRRFQKSQCGSADRPSDPKTYITRRLDAEHCAFGAAAGQEG